MFDGFFLNFYIYFNIIGLLVILYKFLIENRHLKIGSLGILLIGFIFYLFGNLIFISDIRFNHFNLSDLFFIIQVFSKQYFMFNSTAHLFNKDYFLNLLKFNFLVLIISLLLLKFFNYNFIDILYFTESLGSMIFLLYVNFVNTNLFNLFGKLDLDYFFIGQICWLVGDIVYSEVISANTYLIGDYSDFFFFVGFYFFLKSFYYINPQFNFNIVKTYN